MYIHQWTHAGMPLKVNVVNDISNNKAILYVQTYSTEKKAIDLETSWGKAETHSAW